MIIDIDSLQKMGYCSASPKGGNLRFSLDNGKKIDKRTATISEMLILNCKGKYDSFCTAKIRFEYEKNGKNFIAPVTDTIAPFYNPVTEELVGPLFLEYVVSYSKNVSIAGFIPNNFGNCYISRLGLKQAKSCIGTNLKLTQHPKGLELIASTPSIIKHGEDADSIIFGKFEDFESGLQEDVVLQLENDLFVRHFNVAKELWILLRNNVMETPAEPKIFQK